MKNVEYFGVFLYPNVCLVPACGRGGAQTDLEIGNVLVCASVDNKPFFCFSSLFSMLRLCRMSGGACT